MIGSIPVGVNGRTDCPRLRGLSIEGRFEIAVKEVFAQTQPCGRVKVDL
jgi:hypothetical protein